MFMDRYQRLKAGPKVRLRDIDGLCPSKRRSAGCFLLVLGKVLAESVRDDLEELCFYRRWAYVSRTASTTRLTEQNPTV